MIRPSDIPPNVLAALKACVETDRAHDRAFAAWESERSDANDIALGIATQNVDDDVQELGAQCWAWLRKLGVVEAIEKEKGAAECSICRRRHGLEIIHACE